MKSCQGTKREAMFEPPGRMARSDKDSQSGDRQRQYVPSPHSPGPRREGHDRNRQKHTHGAGGKEIRAGDLTQAQLFGAREYSDLGGQIAKMNTAKGGRGPAKQAPA
jgi:hypothetical protein